MSTAPASPTYSATVSTAAIGGSTYWQWMRLFRLLETAVLQVLPRRPASSGVFGRAVLAEGSPSGVAGPASFGCASFLFCTSLQPAQNKGEDVCYVSHGFDASPEMRKDLPPAGEARGKRMSDELSNHSQMLKKPGLLDLSLS
jgi:hypothetical protein